MAFYVPSVMDGSETVGILFSGFVGCDGFKGLDEIEDLERYSPYYTDHDALLLTVNFEVT